MGDTQKTTATTAATATLQQRVQSGACSNYAERLQRRRSQQGSVLFCVSFSRIYLHASYLFRNFAL